MNKRDAVVVQVPGDTTKLWHENLNTAFGGGRFLLALTTDTWWTDPQRCRATAYLQPHDQIGRNGWKQNLLGIFDAIIYTNLPEVSQTRGNGSMLGLKEARVDGAIDEIDPGHITLVALHDVIGSLQFHSVPAASH